MNDKERIEQLELEVERLKQRIEALCLAGMSVTRALKFTYDAITPPDYRIPDPEPVFQKVIDALSSAREFVKPV